MDASVITDYIMRYGGMAVFIIVLLEYMNLPGFPAGIIMPLAGLWAAQGNMHFAAILLLTVAAGMCGSWILYALGYTGGNMFLKAYIKRFPKHEEAIERNLAMLRKRGCLGIFISKLIPMVRTLISIPAGIMKMNFVKYTISSLCGIIVWNFVFVGMGYWFGGICI